jgi:hypothetical protein
MNPIGSSRFNLLYGISQAGKVGGKNRRGN